MPVINIYLDKELYEFVKIDKSKIIKQALKDYIEKLKHNQNRKNKTPGTETPAEIQD